MHASVVYECTQHRGYIAAEAVAIGVESLWRQHNVWALSAFQYANIPQFEHRMEIGILQDLVVFNNTEKNPFILI